MSGIIGCLSDVVTFCVERALGRHKRWTVDVTELNLPRAAETLPLLAGTVHAGPDALLELVAASPHWLTLPDSREAMRGARANLDLLHRLLIEE